MRAQRRASFWSSAGLLCAPAAARAQRPPALPRLRALPQRAWVPQTLALAAQSVAQEMSRVRRAAALAEVGPWAH